MGKRQNRTLRLSGKPRKIALKRNSLPSTNNELGPEISGAPLSQSQGPVARHDEQTVVGMSMPAA